MHGQFAHGAASPPLAEQGSGSGQPSSSVEEQARVSTPTLSDTGDAQAIARSASAVQAVKAAVAELRVNVKSAVSHREKCSILLSAAMASSLALEQVLYTGGIDKLKENQIQRLCSDLIAATDLAATRVQVYGRAPKWKKYVKITQRHAIQLKFDELVLRLKHLTQQAWSLQSEPSRPRISVTRLHTESPGDSEALDTAVLSALAQGIQHTVLSRTRLRKGGQAQKIRALMYIPAYRSSGAHQALGQVWWYASGFIRGKVSVHNVATSKTLEVPMSTPVSCLQLDTHGNIWVGHRGGTVGVYSEAACAPICADMRCCSCDIMCMMVARSGMAWVGSEEGSVHLMSLMRPSTPGNATARLQLATKQANTRSWRNMLSPRSGSLTSKRSSSFSNKLAIGGALEPESFTISSGKFSHDGPVTAIHGCGTRVWSAGSSRNTSLMEWAADGRLRHTIAVPAELGAINTMEVMPMWDGGRQVEGRTSRDVVNALATAPPVMSNEIVNWILATGHERGAIQIWDGRGGPVVPCLVIPAWRSPCRSLVVCESLGLWCSGHADGTIVLRLLSALDLDGRPPAQEGQAVGKLQPPEQQAILQSHRSGLDRMVGCHLGVITASQFGSIDLWPETELRQAAESAGFVLPTAEESYCHLARLHSGTYPPADWEEDNGKKQINPQSVSTMLQRYFTPASSALAVAAVQRAVETESQRRSLIFTGGRPHGDSAELGRDSNASMSSTSTARGLLAEVVSLLRPLEGGADGEQMPFDASFSPAISYRTSVDKDSAMIGSFRPDEQPARRASLEAAHAAVDVAPLRQSQDVPRASSLSDNMSLGSDSRSTMGSLSTGLFRPEAHSDWIIDFKDLQFLRLMGEGSIGRVHHGRWQQTDVAIKTINSLSHMRTELAAEQASEPQTEGSAEEHKLPIAQGSLLDDQQNLLRSLEREVGVMAAIRHPNVVLFMGVCLEPACLITEWCSRGSVYDILMKARSNPALGAQLDWPRRLSMALDAAKGMLQLHSHRPHILHRDLKSPNLVVDKHWRVKVTDFNLSRIMYNTTVTSSVSANNPRWLAPEAISHQNFTKAADVYSFGIILWELLAWQLPWDGFGPFQIMVAVAERGQRPDIPQDLAATPGGASPAAYGLISLLQRCWAQDPADRPAFDIIVITLRSLLESVARRRPSGKQPLSPGGGSTPPQLSPAPSGRPEANGGPRASQLPSPTAAHQQTDVPGVPASIRESPSAEHEAAFDSARSSLSRGSSMRDSLAGDPSGSVRLSHESLRFSQESSQQNHSIASLLGSIPAPVAQPTIGPLVSASPFASAAALGSFASLESEDNNDVLDTASGLSPASARQSHRNSPSKDRRPASHDAGVEQAAAEQQILHEHHAQPSSEGLPAASVPEQSWTAGHGSSSPRSRHSHPASSSFRFARHHGDSASGVSTPWHPGQPQRHSADGSDCSSTGKTRPLRETVSDHAQLLANGRKLSEREARALWQRTSPAAVPRMHRRRSLSTGEGIALLLATFGGGKHPQYPQQDPIAESTDPREDGQQ